MNFRARGQKVTVPEPEVKPVHVKIQLKGPHCWVDDATVTSDTSEQELADPGDSKKTEVGKTPLVKRPSQQELHKIKTENNENETKQTIEKDNPINDLNLDEETETYNFPPFLCPSSEKKSREAAIKEWLAHTCFRSAHRGVPMVWWQLSLAHYLCPATFD